MAFTKNVKILLGLHTTFQNDNDLYLIVDALFSFSVRGWHIVVHVYVNVTAHMNERLL